MKCVEREKIFAYIHHLLESRQAVQVRAHVAECARCRAVIAEYRKLDSVLEEWKPIEPSPSFDARLRAAIERSAPAHAPLSWLGIPALRWLAPAMILALVVVSSALVVRVRHSHHESGTALPRVTATAAPSAASAEEPVQDELTLDENLPVLENYDLLVNFEVLSELPRSETQVED